jgi:lipopolysaccharide/colanic/teichoic acid biosynthesis glycosyltransferase
MKRVVDVLISSFALFLLAIPMLFLSLQIWRRMGSPIFFQQTRPGLGGEPFEMVKFRTMSNTYDSSGNLLGDAQRITSFGKFLRSTSLDELPELWNVLKGDMSLVGPRPLLMEYIPLYSPEQARRHVIRPGITGWAQVNGRNAISWDEKFRLDVWYVDNQSLLLDFRIILLTIKKVFFREDIAEKGQATMSKFTGTSTK